MIDIECEIWIPAARPDVIRKDNVGATENQTRTAGREHSVHCRKPNASCTKAGTLVLPDFIANAGGVICASVEYHGGTQAQALQTIEEKIRANTEEVLANAKKSGTLPRQAAVELAEARVKKAMTYQK